MITPSLFIRAILPALAGIIAVTVASSSLEAGDEQAAKSLEALGGKVVQKDGAVTEVTFTDCGKIGASELNTIGGLQHLKSLTLFGKVQGLNDSSVDALTSLQELESLSTEGADLSDAGLARLASLANLKRASFFHLSFRKDGFTGKGFAAWSKLTKLERLTVAGMSMGDDGFAAIATITSLRELSTWHTFQTEAGNALIAKLPNLTSLKLGQRLPRQGVKEPSLSDASMSTLAGIKTLESLKIGEGRFSFSGLSALKSLPNLKSLLIYESEVAEADLEQLKAALVGVHVELQPLTEEQRKKLEAYLK